MQVGVMNNVPQKLVHSQEKKVKKAAWLIFLVFLCKLWVDCKLSQADMITIESAKFSQIVKSCRVV